MKLSVGELSSVFAFLPDLSFRYGVRIECEAPLSMMPCIRPSRLVDVASRVLCCSSDRIDERRRRITERWNRSPDFASLYSPCVLFEGWRLRISAGTSQSRQSLVTPLFLLKYTRLLCMTAGYKFANEDVEHGAVPSARHCDAYAENRKKNGTIHPFIERVNNAALLDRSRFANATYQHLWVHVSHGLAGWHTDPI